MTVDLDIYNVIGLGPGGGGGWWGGGGGGGGGDKCYIRPGYIMKAIQRCTC
jgi:hypothetical protein